MSEALRGEAVKRPYTRFVPGRRWESFTSGEIQAPAEPAVRKANLHRIIRLFRPYRAGWASSPSADRRFRGARWPIPPFLLRAVLDTAIQIDPDGQATVDMNLLVALVAGMVAIPIVTGVLGVWQTRSSRTSSARR